MVDSILDNVANKDEYSNKKIITKERYDELIQEYVRTVQKYNGIVTIYDNPTATSYPYQNDKQDTTYIKRDYRDTDKESFDDYQSSFSEDYIDPNETYIQTLNKGYYEITLIGAGSGGLSFSGTPDDQLSAYSPDCSSESGWGGAFLKIKTYFPFKGDLKIKVGKGSNGIKLLKENNPQGVDYGDRTYGFFTEDGGTTEVYFNDDLVAKCYGGRGAAIFKHNYTFSDVYYTYPDKKPSEKGGTFEQGNYISEIIESYIGGDCTYGSKGDSNVHECLKSYPYEYSYGLGGSAKAVSGKNEDNVYFANSGNNGFVHVELITIDEVDYLKDDIKLESNVIHTLGNENEIRRNLQKALDKMYNKIITTEPLTQDTCNVIGKEVNESDYINKINGLKKYSELKEILENGYNIYSPEVGYLSKVVTKHNKGCFPEDDYILTYDYDTLRRLELKDWKEFDENVSVPTYIPYINENNDTIYIQGIPEEDMNVDVYSSPNTKLGEGRYYISTKEELELKNPSEEFIKRLENNIYLNVLLVGAGGGAGGTSNHDKWKTSGGVGGSGGLINGIWYVKKGQRIKISVGKGGISGIGYKQGGETGETGGSSVLMIDNNKEAEAKGGTGGQGSRKHGGNCGYSGNGGDIEWDNEYEPKPKILKEIRGNGYYKKVNDDYSESITVDDRDVGIYRTGNPSVLEGTNYGAGAPALKPDYGGQDSRSIPAENGYAKIYIINLDRVTYNNSDYYISNDVDDYSSVILWDNYQYDLQKLNRLKEYVATKDSWFDNEGYCQRSCQINCQTTVQKS